MEISALKKTILDPLFKKSVDSFMALNLVDIKENNNVDFDSIMIDIETLDTVPSAAIVQVAIVEFNSKTARIGSIYFANIKDDCYGNISRTESEQTLKWWEAKKEQYQEIQSHTINLDECVKAIELFFKCINGNEHIVYANPPGFDLTILKDVFSQYDLKIPWNPWNERCLRTMKKQYPELIENIQFEGKKHNAIDDCLHQIKQVVAIENFITIAKELLINKQQ